MTPPTTDRPLTEPAQQTGQGVGGYIECPACAKSVRICSNGTYPQHKIRRSRRSHLALPWCPRSGRPVSP